MNQTHTLIKHQDIQKWVTARHGMPAISRVPNGVGQVRARLALKFGRHETQPVMPQMDDGMSPVSWNTWLAELDRQHLALKVSNQTDDDFEFVERRETTPGNSGEALN